MNDAAAEAPVQNTESRGRDISTSRVLLALIRREFWEHRALWMVPPAICGLLLLSAALGRFGLGYSGGVPPTGPFPWTQHMDVPADTDLHTAGIAMFSLRQWALSIPLYLAATVILYFYLCSSLFDERKDRSILFWKSLPVSDAATVASKLLVALVVVPLGVFLLSLVNHLLFTAIWDTRAGLGRLSGWFIWDTVAWFKVEGLMLISVVMSVLWYAPVAAYLLLISAWARRNVFLWAVLPPLILAILERVALGTSYVNSLFMYRLGGIWVALGLDHVSRTAMLNTTHGKLLYLPRVFDALDGASLFANTGLWVGLLIAGALTYAAVRVRRYRDDT